jgi:uncharacterized membrane protein
MTLDSLLPKGRLEALSDGVYSIALTLLVLELKLPGLGGSPDDAAIRAALLDVLPKGLVWLLSFAVMATFWVAQQRALHASGALTRGQLRVELAQLALVSLMPFTTALMGEHGVHPMVATLYAAHLCALAVLGRTRLALLRRGADAPDAGLRTLARRATLVVACTAAATALGPWVPAWNMLALLPLLGAALLRAR